MGNGCVIAKRGPSPNQTLFGTLRGGRLAITSKLGVVCNFSCGNPKISRYNPSKKILLALRKAAGTLARRPD